MLGGAIAHGSSILAAQAAGADLAYVGSAFLSTDEAVAPAAYKDMVVAAGASDVVASDWFSGITANYLRGSIAAVGLDPDALPRHEPGTPAFARPAGVDEPSWRAWHDIWGCGQGVGAIGVRRCVADLVSHLRSEYDDAVADLLPRLGPSAPRP
ncbi:nitronate monooxygenase family protein [Nocardioides montaniterrae]